MTWVEISKTLYNAKAHETSIEFKFSKRGVAW